jgi:hypothetical protein
MKKDYIKQLEDANAELQRNLEEQGNELAKCERIIRDRKPRLVVFCEHPIQELTGSGRSMSYSAHLMVTPCPPVKKLKVYAAYHISNNLDLYISIKDRQHKVGSIYDMDMITAYAAGEDVKPYVI